MVVGAGPTGVEMAGQIAEIARDTRRDFRTIDTSKTKVLLVEAGDRVLASFPPKLSKRAAKSLESLGVTPLVNHLVTDLDADGVTMESTGACGPGRSSGPRACSPSGLSVVLAAAAGAETDKVGRLLVEPDLTLPAHPEVFAIGDMVQVRGADPLPGVAPVAMQMGRYVAKAVRFRLRSKELGPFKYKDKGNLATIGRARAVADLPPRIRVGGFIAWALWLGIHLFYLIGFQNRLLVLLRWALQLPHARAWDAADHRRAEYALAVILAGRGGLRRPDRSQPAADPRSAARPRAPRGRAGR